MGFSEGLPEHALNVPADCVVHLADQWAADPVEGLQKLPRDSTGRGL